jgi:GC-rich sequence DNA-binding factor
MKNILLWRREAPREVEELCTRVVGEICRPILVRCWGGGGMEVAQEVSLPKDTGADGEVLGVVKGVLPPDLVQFLRDGPGRW